MKENEMSKISCGGHMVVIQDHHRKPITCIKDWPRPKRPDLHWQPGRSAVESAKAWLRHGTPAVPEEILAILETHPSTKGFQARVAFPEAVIRLDNYRGGQRNTDMLVVGDPATVVAIEAKADEEFGPTIENYLRSIRNPKSNVKHRIRALSLSIFGKAEDEEIQTLRYQLLHGVAAALIEAKRLQAKQGVFIVHEFLSSKLDSRKLERNRQDLKQFIRILAKSPDLELQPDQLSEPYTVPGDKFVPSNIPVFIGKTVVNLDTQ